MKKKPTIVHLLRVYGNQFVIKFPNMSVPLTVSKYDYEKMVNTPDEYVFV